MAYLFVAVNNPISVAAMCSSLYLTARIQKKQVSQSDNGLIGKQKNGDCKYGLAWKNCLRPKQCSIHFAIFGLVCLHESYLKRTFFAYFYFAVLFRA